MRKEVSKGSEICNWGEGGDEDVEVAAEVDVETVIDERETREGVQSGRSAAGSISDDWMGDAVKEDSLFSAMSMYVRSTLSNKSPNSVAVDRRSQDEDEDADEDQDDVNIVMPKMRLRDLEMIR